MTDTQWLNLQRELLKYSKVDYFSDELISYITTSLRKYNLINLARAKWGDKQLYEETAEGVTQWLSNTINKRLASRKALKEKRIAKERINKLKDFLK